ncbi:MAG: DUF4177 domain-containing protein [Bryobacteraceae bacterium]|nr:DUF4177 domain-containing protein [Bryobacteraceae bacterium]
MKPLTALLLIVLTVFFLTAQTPQPRRKRSGDYPVWEVKVLQPVEVTPARYRQVTERELNDLAYEGWELVSMTPFTYLNEERGKEKTMVTQTYPSYVFKRQRKELN